ncbi:ribosome maturation factor RimM [Conexibacter arvalis]|uniref:Ribosome maturation factor RimM n=1 Tax=Conexibacter arvalis TaxID=912552 RepID=A0A840IL24_9ACTN|nr:ribosome maturation factor RimM [Conexibacter arvalis]MBB4664620.1 16S rRNA processing protein RimM [Conexibacter arvalis]
MSPDPARRSPDAENSDGERWLHAGRIGRPHGLDGSVHVTQPRVALLEQGRVLRVDGRDDEIVRRAGTDSRPIIRLASCTSRTQAESLRGRELLVARADAPELEEDEWWPEELEGCRVRDGEREVGVVRSLRPLPSCDVLEVAREGAEDLLVPLIRDAVRSVDVEAREIDVDLVFLGEEPAAPSADDPTAPPAADPAAPSADDPAAPPAADPAAPSADDPGP